MTVACNTPKKFKVAICGAGIGGLALAISLMQYPDIDVEIFEGANCIGKVGAGIVVYPRVWKTLQSLGLEEELLKCTEEKIADEDVCSFLYRHSDQHEGRDIFTMLVRGGMCMFHRADFHGILLHKIGKRYPLHTSKRLRSYIQSPPQTSSSVGPHEQITLEFEDGCTTTCDLLVGADGLHSAVRHTLLTDVARACMQEGKKYEANEALDGVEPKWNGCVAYRAIVSAESLAAMYPGHQALSKEIFYIGKGATVVVYPIQHGKNINVVFVHSRHELENTDLGKRPGPMERKITDIAPLFENWEPEVQALIACADVVNEWPIQTVKPLKSFVFNRVCLIGDSAHAMSPFQSSGAGQAIEDALVLSAILGHSSVTLTNVTTALTAYDEIRRPFSQDVQVRSSQNGKWLSLYEGSFESMERNVVDKWKWAWETTADSMVDEAIALLERKLS